MAAQPTTETMAEDGLNLSSEKNMQIDYHSSDVVQFMIHKDTGSASAAVEDQPDLINWRDEKGWSLLHHAAWHGSSEVINSLVKAGAEVDLKDLVKGVTPLMAAAEKGQEEALKTLVKAGADVNATDSEGKGVVVRSGSSSVLRLLLDAGIDLDHRDSLG
ncbi:Death-associated protein kinase 1 [Portunus trituberculatus]|uniref:Death-associated protein kinase 1 n=1 Tax=Portunus trituberculatus TaxID=210409 RepID=A0A5B7D537_PORTR|nr:Death-associated protein kinase 1 [Portunus trituberculatus]